MLHKYIRSHNEHDLKTIDEGRKKYNIYFFLRQIKILRNEKINEKEFRTRIIFYVETCKLRRALFLVIFSK